MDMASSLQIQLEVHFQIWFLTIQISGKDSCTGDSGGPLVSREYSDDPWYQVGIRTVPQGITTTAKNKNPEN